MPGHLGVDRVTTLNLKVRQTDVARGLILVEGAVPGVKGGWITVRDAVKKKLPDGVPKPGKFKLAEAASPRRSQPLSAEDDRRASDMELQVTTLDGKKAGSVTLSDAIFGLEPRTDLIHRCVVWQLAKRQRGTHEVKNRADIHRTGKKMYRQKGTGSARHGSARVNLFRGGGRSFGPHTRSHEIGLPKKVRALALRHALSAKAKDGGILVIEALAREGSQDQGAARPFRQARRLPTRCSSTAPKSRPRCAPRRAIFRISTCCRSPASMSTTSCGGISSC